MSGLNHFATVDSDALPTATSKPIKTLCCAAHPGAGIDGRYDVDGLSSRAVVAFAASPSTAGVRRWGVSARASLD